MFRKVLFVTLLAGLMGIKADVVTAAVNPSEHLANLLKQKAQRVFELSDKDQNQGLSPGEQVDAERRMQNVFSRLSQDHVLAGPRIPLLISEPQPLDPNSVAAEEFSQYFQAKAAQFDAQLRARRLALSRPPVVPILPVVVVVPSASRWDNQRWRNRDDGPYEHHGQNHFVVPQTNASPAMNDWNGVTTHVQTVVPHHQFIEARGNPGIVASGRSGNSFGGGGGGSGGSHTDHHAEKHHAGNHHHGK